jgi:hypothetical protein
MKCQSRPKEKPIRRMMKQPRHSRSIKKNEPSSYIFSPISRASRTRSAMFIVMITIVLMPATAHKMIPVASDVPLRFGKPSAAHNPAQNDIAIIANEKSTLGNPIGRYCISRSSPANAMNARCPKSMVLKSELTQLAVLVLGQRHASCSPCRSRLRSA